LFEAAAVFVVNVFWSKQPACGTYCLRSMLHPADAVCFVVPNSVPRNCRACSWWSSSCRHLSDRIHSASARDQFGADGNFEPDDMAVARQRGPQLGATRRAQIKFLFVLAFALYNLVHLADQPLLFRILSGQRSLLLHPGSSLPEVRNTSQKKIKLEITPVQRH
jgi:hypothetical protein